MTEGEFHHYCESYAGYCLKCDDVTNFCGVEPDACNYVCDECESKTVFGVDIALIAGHIDIV